MCLMEFSEPEFDDYMLRSISSYKLSLNENDVNLFILTRLNLNLFYFILLPLCQFIL